MWTRSISRAFLISAALWASTAVPARAQQPANGPYPPAGQWRAAGTDGGVVPAAAALPATPYGNSPTYPAPAVPAAAPSGNPFLAQPVRVARRTLHVTAGNGSLPNDQGQVWRDYDISSYTARVTTTKRPEQAIVDWILR